MSRESQAPPGLLLVGNVTRDLDETDHSRFIHGGFDHLRCLHQPCAMGVSAAEAVTRVAPGTRIFPTWQALARLDRTAFGHHHFTFVNQYRGEDAQAVVLSVLRLRITAVI